MKRKNIRSFRCPECKSANLTIEDARQETEEIIDGNLLCADCRASYQVHNSVPRFVSEENYAQSFGFQWSIHQKTQLDSYTGLSVSRKRLFDVTGWPAKMPGQRILEAGSGAGRFTECLTETGAEIFSFDYSNAVNANWRNNGQCDRLQLFQADMRKLPLKIGSFDKVMCLGVLQHTPNPSESFQFLAEMVRPGGELVIDVYRRDFLALLQWKYVLRPLTKRVPQHALYKAISWVVPLLQPVAKNMRRVAGRAGARIAPIVDFSHLGLSEELNKEWTILDTFDMYAPAYDRPQTHDQVGQWYRAAGFEDVVVASGPNGLVGRGRRAALAVTSPGGGIGTTKCAESLA